MTQPKPRRGFHSFECPVRWTWARDDVDDMMPMISVHGSTFGPPCN